MADRPLLAACRKNRDFEAMLFHINPGMWTDKEGLIDVYAQDDLGRN